MKISARNILPGKVTSIKKGPISSVITLEVAPGLEVVSSITSESAASLKIKKGQKATPSSRPPASSWEWIEHPVRQSARRGLLAVRGSAPRGHRHGLCRRQPH